MTGLVRKGSALIQFFPFFLVGMVLLGVLACSRIPLEKVSPPDDLDRLDESVRQQFKAWWQRVEESRRNSPQIQGQTWGGLGNWFFAYKYPTSAARCYKNAQNLDSLNPKWPYFLGLLLLDKGDLTQAKQQFLMAHNLDSTALQPTMELAKMAAVAQELDQAEALFKSILGVEENQPEALFGLASLHLTQGRTEEGIHILAKLMDQQPDVSQAHYLMGTAYSQLGDSEKASFHFSKVPEDNNLHVGLQIQNAWLEEVFRQIGGSREFSRRGVVAFKKGDYESAVRLMEKAVADNPDHTDMRVNYAVALEKIGLTNLAIAQLRYALGQEPDNLRGNLFFGKISLKHGRLQEAERYLTRAYAIDPRSMEGLIQLGRLRQNQGQTQEAITLYGQARALEEPLESTRFWHAALLLQAKRDQEAASALAEDVQLFPDSGDLVLLQIRLWVVSKDPKIRNLQAAQMQMVHLLKSPTVFVAETQAMVSASLGDFARAVAWQKVALETLENTPLRQAQQVARRRLALYTDKKVCSLGWEGSERPVNREVSLPKLGN